MTTCQIDTESLRCVNCGSVFVDPKTISQCPPPTTKAGLGDMVKAGLSAFGITEQRVSKAIGQPCGCGKRAEKLNELGHKYLGLPPGESAAAS